MTTAALILAAIAVLPSDRMVMADRLFNRGAYADAKAMKVPAKYEAEKAEYIKMASAFVTMLRLSTALYTPQ